MSRASRLVLALALLSLIPLAVSAQLVCCAGMASMHSMDMDDEGCGNGMGCCNKAHDDALARHCCEGGERAHQSQSLPQFTAASAAAVPATIELDRHGLVEILPSSLPPPKHSALFTLHSAFLI